jgi:predicted DsbA family dithiol-disulfide isomerase
MQILELNKKKIKVDIVSDVVCPWCYVGKKRIDEAIESLKDEFDFELVYHPFQLDPTIPEQGIDQAAYFIKKFGSEERVDTVFTQVEAAGESVGIDFKFREIPKAINTLGLHAIIAVALTEGIQQPVKQALFEAYMVNPIDLSNLKNVAEVMKSFGWNEEKTFSILNNKDLIQHVKTEIAQMQQLGISGVPFFIINNKYGVSGAQQSKTFVEVFRNLKPEDFPEMEKTSCEIGGDC